MSWLQYSVLYSLLLAAVWCGGADSSKSCQLNSAEMMKQRRIQTLRNSILAQLGVSNPSPANNTEPLPGETEMKETFNALRSASASLEREKEQRCHSDDFYAKPVSSFVGFLSDELYMGGRARREAEGSPNTDNLLHSYAITFNFSLPSTLTDVSRADLLLYQQDSVTPDTIVRDRRQYVEIRTVLESLGQKFIVEGKYIDIYETGYQVFEITSAIKLWIARRIEGLVTMEVNVYCYSSPNCSQLEGDDLLPAGVSFLASDTQQEKAPRIITVSKNPLDVQHQERKRRNADTQLTGVGQCSTNQSTCCLKNFELNFHDDLGLSFILLPENFTANYCEGVCPEIMGGQLMTPRIFELFSRLPETNPGSSVEPCCTGNQYKPLEVLVRKDGELFIEELSHVTVLSCRCT